MFFLIIIRIKDFWDIPWENVDPAWLSQKTRVN
jgi:hypothetical protein